MSAPPLEVVEPESVGMSAAMLANIDALVDGHIAADAYQGSVVLVSRHGRVCYFKAFGRADEGRDMTTDAIFRYASMSKVPSAAALLQLWDRGLISLADPVAEYIPAFRQPKVAELRDGGVIALTDAKREITLHDLLTMTAGLTNTWWYDRYPPRNYTVVPKLYAEAGIVDDFTSSPMTLEENVDRVARMPLMWHPGDNFDYSNNSVDTFCRVVEIVSGQDFDSYLRQHLFDPLGMDDVWFFPPEHEHQRVAAVYLAGSAELQSDEIALGLGKMGPGYTFGPHRTYFSGAGGLHGTTAAYHRFAQMLLNKGVLDGERVLSRAAVELMTSNQIGDLTNWQLTQNKWGYQLDLQEGVNAPAGSIHYLGGRGAYSWQGFWSTKFVNNPDRDTSILAMTAVGFDGALPHALRLIAAANAAVID